jgi:hypothetical protein
MSTLTVVPLVGMVDVIMGDGLMSKAKALPQNAQRTVQLRVTAARHSFHLPSSGPAFDSTPRALPMELCWHFTSAQHRSFLCTAHVVQYARILNGALLPPLFTLRNPRPRPQVTLQSTAARMLPQHCLHCCSLHARVLTPGEPRPRPQQRSSASPSHRPASTPTSCHQGTSPALQARGLGQAPSYAT